MYEELTSGEDTLCTICNAEFLDSEDLTIHTQQMHSVAPKFCQFCPESYTDLMDYAQHVKETHLSDLRSCKYCTKVFLLREKLKLHENKHVSTPNVYSCSQCENVFPEVRLLVQHERDNHYNDIDGCFVKCMPYLSSLLNLKAVSLLQSVGKMNFVCLICKFSSTSLTVYMKHLKKKKCKVCVCDRCSTPFKYKRYLVKHLLFTKKCLGSKETKEGMTKCKECNIKIPNYELLYHTKSCQVLRCIDCNLSCKNIEELSNHQAKEHPLDITVIRCRFCLKEFIGKQPLKNHIFRVHYPSFHLYKYKCFDCKVIFKHPQKLFAHYYTKHKEIEPFTCKICDKKFRIRKAFSLHIKLDHKSVGFVEFDNKYHVFFTATKSDTPFIPECVVPKEMFDEYKEDKKLKGFSIRAQDQPDTDATEVDTEDEKPLKRKPPIKTKAKKRKADEISSDEEPLNEVRKRVLKKSHRKNWTWKKKISKSQFTCNICNKNCYTYQNHQNHMSLHNKGQDIECVKCSRRFSSKEQLRTHISKEHASSKLTETLKNLLEKKKQDFTDEPIVTNKPEKFTITLKKVVSDNSHTVSATIKPIETNMNVKNFLENFTPELSETPKAKITSSISIAQYLMSPVRETKIKLTKFRDEPKVYKPVPLKMPERFQHDSYGQTKVTIKLIEETTNEYILPEYEHNYSEAFQDDKTDDIPEVAHEISLVGTEEPSQSITKIVIPKMPKGYSNIHIATLQSEAPYFKIIKVDSDNLTEIKETVEEPEPIVRSDVIDLPGGTKLVTANPLAHLLGDTQLDKILEPVKKKYYKPVIKDFSGMLAQAMQKLEEPPKKRKRKIKSKPVEDKVVDK